MLQTSYVEEGKGQAWEGAAAWAKVNSMGGSAFNAQRDPSLIPAFKARTNKDLLSDVNHPDKRCDFGALAKELQSSEVPPNKKNRLLANCFRIFPGYHFGGCRLTANGLCEMLPHPLPLPWACKRPVPWRIEPMAARDINSCCRGNNLQCIRDSDREVDKRKK